MTIPSSETSVQFFQSLKDQVTKISINVDINHIINKLVLRHIYKTLEPISELTIFLPLAHKVDFQKLIRSILENNRVHTRRQITF